MPKKETNTGYKGITYMKREEKYEARVKYKGKSKGKAKLHSIYVGLYETLDEARIARTDFILTKLL